MSLEEEKKKHLAKAKALARWFAEDAAERDRAGGTPKRQKDALRDSGLLHVYIPKEYGGGGQPWSTVLHIMRELSKTDASLGHLFGYHNLALAYLSISGSPEQHRVNFEATVAEKWFWGNASNPLDQRLLGRQEGERFVLNGAKTFSSGSPDSDLLGIAWIDESDRDRRYMGFIPTSREGVCVQDDWDSIGQRQTGSGSVLFKEVTVYPEEVLAAHFQRKSVFSTIGPIMSQSVLTQVFIGSALGALEEAGSYTKTVSRPWFASGVSQASQDPYILRSYGELWMETEAAACFADRAIERLDQALAQQFDLKAEDRAETAAVVAAANVFAGRIGLAVSSRIFELMGARSSGAAYGFDRFWRNVRTHTLHNPADYKLRNVGNWILNGEPAEPSSYS